MSKSKLRGEAALDARSDSLTLTRVRAWLCEHVAGLRRVPHLVRAAETLDDEITALCTRIVSADEIAFHIRAADERLATFGVHAESIKQPTQRASTPNGARSQRWRKRPLSEKERDDLRMWLLHARAEGPKALADAKCNIGTQHGLSPKSVATLLNTCVGKRYALRFAARIVSREPQSQRRTKLVILQDLLGIKRDAIVRAARELAS